MRRRPEDSTPLQEREGREAGSCSRLAAAASGGGWRQVAQLPHELLPGCPAIHNMLLLPSMSAAGRHKRARPPMTLVCTHHCTTAADDSPRELGPSTRSTVHSSLPGPQETSRRRAPRRPGTLASSAGSPSMLAVMKVTCGRSGCDGRACGEPPQHTGSAGARAAARPPDRRRSKCPTPVPPHCPLPCHSCLHLISMMWHTVCLQVGATLGGLQRLHALDMTAAVDWRAPTASRLSPLLLRWRRLLLPA